MKGQEKDKFKSRCRNISDPPWIMGFLCADRFRSSKAKVEKEEKLFFFLLLLHNLVWLKLGALIEYLQSDQSNSVCVKYGVLGWHKCAMEILILKVWREAYPDEL